MCGAARVTCRGAMHSPLTDRVWCQVLPGNAWGQQWEKVSNRVLSVGAFVSDAHGFETNVTNYVASLTGGRQLWREVAAPTLLPYSASVNEGANQINIVTIQAICRTAPAGKQFAFRSAYCAKGCMPALLVEMTTHYLITIQGRC